MALEMQDPPWQWARWIPKSRRKKSTVLPLGYAPGDDRVYYSNPEAKDVIPCAYLMALLRAEDFGLVFKEKHSSELT